jgi:hypothetical protein
MSRKQCFMIIQARYSKMAQYLPVSGYVRKAVRFPANTHPTFKRLRRPCPSFLSPVFLRKVDFVIDFFFAKLICQPRPFTQPRASLPPHKRCMTMKESYVLISFDMKLSLIRTLTQLDSWRWMRPENMLVVYAVSHAKPQWFILHPRRKSIFAGR